MSTRQVQLDIDPAHGERQQWFVETGSMNDPIASLRRRDGASAVLELYVEPKNDLAGLAPRAGVLVIAQMASREGGSFTISLLQEGMRPDGAVVHIP